jgi:hypothetical protein
MKACPFFKAHGPCVGPQKKLVEFAVDVGFAPRGAPSTKGAVMRVWHGVLGLVLGLTWTAALAADDAARPAEAPGKPGAIHAALAKLAGDYTTASSFRVKPDEPATETTGKAKLTVILGGRFLQEEGTGALFGQPTAGFHLTGYNDATQQYEALWVYTGSTAMMRLFGKSPDHGKTIEWTATFESGKDEKTTLQVVTRVLDEDHFTTTLSAKNPDGSQGPTLETKYSRKR